MATREQEEVMGRGRISNRVRILGNTHASKTVRTKLCKAYIRHTIFDVCVILHPETAVCIEIYWPFVNLNFISFGEARKAFGQQGFFSGTDRNILRAVLECLNELANLHPELP
ncbi:MAG: hypothetical protein WC663_00460 [Patescibacteria group bacterium]|jgi:hypothetical protein